MRKKTFFIGMGILFICSTAYLPLVINSPLSSIIIYQLLGVISTIFAIIFWKIGCMKAYSISKQEIIYSVQTTFKTHNFKFVLSIGVIAIIILVPIILYLPSDILLNLIQVPIDMLNDTVHFPYITPMMLWIFTDLNAYAFLVYVISYTLIFHMFCKKTCTETFKLQNSNIPFHGDYIGKSR